MLFLHCSDFGRAAVTRLSGDLLDPQHPCAAVFTDRSLEPTAFSIDDILVYARHRVLRGVESPP